MFDPSILGLAGGLAAFASGAAAVFSTLRNLAGAVDELADDPALVRARFKENTHVVHWFMPAESRSLCAREPERATDASDEVSCGACEAFESEL